MLFFAKAVFLVLLVVVAGFCALISLQMILFYYLFDVVAALSFFVGISLYLDFHKIQLLNWSNSNKESDLPIKETDEILVKIAKRYVNNATYNQIKKEFGFVSNEQVTRAIKQRLKDTM